MKPIESFCFIITNDSLNWNYYKRHLLQTLKTSYNITFVTYL